MFLEDLCFLMGTRGLVNLSVWVALEVRLCVEGISPSKLILYGSLVGRILMLETGSLVGGLSLVGGKFGCRVWEMRGGNLVDRLWELVFER